MRAKPDESTLGAGGLDSYIPSPEQQERANLLKRLATSLERAGATYSITGGYGLDGLYGKLTRDHDDIDILSTSEDAERVRKVIRAAGFRIEIIKIRGDVEVYMHDRTNTKLEFGTNTRFQEYSEMDVSEFLPASANASIDGVPFRTPTVAGQEEIQRVQSQRAQEGQWGRYPHEQWLADIMDAIKKVRDNSNRAS